MTESGGRRQDPGTASSAARLGAASRVVPPIERLVEEHGSFVHRFLRRLGVASSDVEDEAIEVFVRVHARLADFDPTKPMRPWLAAFVVRVASESRRRTRNRPVPSSDRSDPVEPSANPEESAADAQKRARLGAALDGLSDEQRVVLVMAFIEGMTMPEIAEILSIPLNTGYSRLRLARDELKAVLADLRPSGGRR